MGLREALRALATVDTSLCPRLLNQEGSSGLQVWGNWKVGGAGKLGVWGRLGE